MVIDAFKPTGGYLPRDQDDEDIEERLRQEERDREQRTLELLERRIGIEDGSLKRLGEWRIFLSQGYGPSIRCGAHQPHGL